MTAPPSTGAGLPAQRPRTDTAGLVRNVRVGRQGIYRADRTLAAYELLFSDRGSGGEETSGERGTSQVIASTFGTFGIDTISDGRPLFVNFTRAFLTGIITIPVEPDRVVVEVVEQAVIDRELVTGLQGLRDDGYRIALADFQAHVDRGGLLEYADYVKVDVTGTSPVMLPGAAGQIAGVGAQMIASNVQDADAFGRCVDLGVALYQGAFLQSPTVLEKRSLSPSQLVCVRLLNDLADPERPIQQIEQMVARDPGLSLRLLRTANSASVSANREVTSLRQALVIIGPRRLRSWVVLTLLEGGTASSPSDDLWAVLARAAACQRLGGAEADLAFTIGMLSGAAELLGVTPGHVAETAGLGSEGRAALLDGEGVAGRALRAVLAHERDEPEAIGATGYLPFDVSRAYLEALSESLALVHDTLRG